jgi:hypothetical protein
MRKVILIIQTIRGSSESNEITVTAAELQGFGLMKLAEHRFMKAGCKSSVKPAS